MKRNISVVVRIGILGGLLALVGYIFWLNEIQYLRPTPVPVDYRPVTLGEQIPLHQHLALDGNKPVFLHFFNPSCPCSRFNVQHFSQLVRQYGKDVTFVVVLQGDQSPSLFDLSLKKIYTLNIPLVKDSNRDLARLCGVYATPQAVLLSHSGQLLFRGNYNLARYCTQEKTNFAEISLIQVLQGEEIPDFGRQATQAWGCSLPE
jgi:thioredoxin-related protein